MNDQQEQSSLQQEQTEPVPPAAAERSGVVELSALHNRSVSQFLELLQDDPAYAYRRAGLTLLYSLPGTAMIRQLEKFGWKARDAQDLFNLGALRSEAGEHREALKYYEKAVEIDPEHYHSQFNLALTYRELGDRRKARAAMQRYLKILEERPELYRWERDSLEEARRFVEELKSDG